MTFEAGLLSFAGMTIEWSLSCRTAEESIQSVRQLSDQPFPEEIFVIMRPYYWPCRAQDGSAGWLCFCRFHCLYIVSIHHFRCVNSHLSSRTLICFLAQIFDFLSSQVTRSTRRHTRRRQALRWPKPKRKLSRIQLPDALQEYNKTSYQWFDWITAWQNTASASIPGSGGDQLFERK